MAMQLRKIRKVLTLLDTTDTITSDVVDRHGKIYMAVLVIPALNGAATVTLSIRSQPEDLETQSDAGLVAGGARVIRYSLGVGHPLVGPTKFKLVTSAVQTADRVFELYLYTD